MQPLESLAKIYAKNIQTEIRRFALDLDIRVEETVEQRSASAFDHALLFGNYGFNDDDIAILASSEGASYNSRPIQVMIIPPHPAGALLVARDNSTVAADFFYIIEKNVIKAIHTTEPVELDLLDLRLDLPYGNAARNKIPGYVLATKPSTQDLTDSKAETNAVLHAAGMLVPKQMVLSELAAAENRPQFFIGMRVDYLEQCLNTLSIDRFVLKGEPGSGGYYVCMFGRHELDEAMGYIRWLEKNGKKVLLEERIKPLQWKNEDDQHIDWNIRAFVTLEEKPQWIDAIVRYNIMSGKPVNICQDACVEELEKTVTRTGASMENIRNTACEVAKALYKHIPPEYAGQIPTDFLGLDLIVSEKGVYTIEVNSAGSGGFAELLEIRKKPLESVRHLLESMGPNLENKHAQRTLNQYKRIPNPVEEYLYLAERFSEDKTGEASSPAIRMYAKALTLINKKTSKTAHIELRLTRLETYSQLFLLYIVTGQYEKAYACHKEIKRASFSEKIMNGMDRLLQLGAAYERQ